jgi:glycosyltransferase involved in cell wall biosynthesis
MATTLREYNPHVAVFPNQVAALSERQVKLDQQHSNEPITVFFGALNRETDWAPLMPNLNQVLQAWGNRVRVQVIYDRAFFDTLLTSHKAFEPLCAYKRYHELLNVANVALLPLENTGFNQHKSDLKFIECAAHGVTALASATVYGRTIIHQRTGLLYQSPDEFEVLLNQLLHDGQLRRELADNAYRYVLENRLLSRHFRARYEWYRTMYEQRDLLSAQIYQRVPELSGG